jgi:hypothetical protein
LTAKLILILLKMENIMNLKFLAAILTSLMMAFAFVSPAHAADEGEAKSIYCDDGSLCVPEGEPEPECD